MHTHIYPQETIVELVWDTIQILVGHCTESAVSYSSASFLTSQHKKVKRDVNNDGLFSEMAKSFLRSEWSNGLTCKTHGDSLRNLRENKRDWKRKK